MTDSINDHKEKMRQICEEVIALKDLFKKPYSEPLPLPIVRLQTHMKPVLGEGSHFARVVFVGEAPGKNEAETGRPFCGAAGRILDELLASISLPREDVYITNIVKDRPPGNRDPLPEEITLYSPFLVRQLDIIEPKVIAALGRFSMDFIFKLFNLEPTLLPISRMHGRVFEAKAAYGPVYLLPLYHPAVAIYNPHTKDELKSDFKVLSSLIK
ncbi:MAG: uracil-DNA glycosylase [bacterium]|nr:uracil-DNA glycosylase [bacterium]